MSGLSGIKQKILAVVDLIRAEIAAKADQASLVTASSAIAPTFSTSVSYSVDDFCTYNTLLYKCIRPHSAGAWDANDFQQTTAAENFGHGGSSTNSEIHFLDGSSGKSYSLSVVNGSLSLTEISSSLSRASGSVTSISFIDKSTGDAYSMTVDNGRIVLEKVQQ